MATSSTSQPPKVRSVSLVSLSLDASDLLTTIFCAHSVHASVPSNTFAIYGNGEDKELTELVPGILNQLGPDSLASLRKLAESYQSLQKADEQAKKDGSAPEAEDDDAIPDLVDRTFEDKVE